MDPFTDGCNAFPVFHSNKKESFTWYSTFSKYAKFHKNPLQGLPPGPGLQFFVKIGQFVVPYFHQFTTGHPRQYKCLYG